jgi:catechol 2,3-dioxygenase-like lactoylglutathione lyase family enzyme
LHQRSLRRDNLLAPIKISVEDDFMTQSAGLGKFKIVAFVTIVDVERAKNFYRDTLGLTLVVEEPPFALVFNANGIMVRLGMSKELPKVPGTVLGWQVPEITSAARELERAGVQLERFDGLMQDEMGIWNSPTGARVAWFRDPDGNILSISEHPEAEVAALLKSS